MSKDNIMKQTDGLFHEVFNEIGKEYPEIEQDHWIIDIGSALIADRPEQFDVIVTLNLYGDIISDIAAQITGSVGLAGSANIGEECAMFEAIHGSAPMIAGQNIANPSGLIQGTIQMLAHIGQSKVGEKIQNAWLKTIEDGIHTADIYKEGVSKRKVSTQEFTDALIERLGQMPSTLKAVKFGESGALKLPKYQRKPARNKELLGVDLFVHWAGTDANAIGKIMEGVNMNNIELNMITNRGIKVYPDGFPETFCTDHWRCRFKKAEGSSMNHADIIALLQKAADNNIDVVKTENLYAFDGKPAFSLGQGQ
jgi:isocitrate dehydrogenase